MTTGDLLLQLVLIASAGGLTIFFIAVTLLRSPEARAAGIFLARRFPRERTVRQQWPSLGADALSVVERIRNGVRVSAAKKRFVSQLPDALDALVSALRAGYALPPALELVARETQGMVRDVFAALSRAHQYQVPMREAVKRICAQVRLQEWDLVAQAIEIQETSGGNIIPTLDELARTLRDKIRVDQEVTTATASGRFSGLLIAGLAPLSLIGFLVFSPSYMSILLHTELGHILLALAALLEVIGFLIIWKMVTIDY